MTGKIPLDYKTAFPPTIMQHNNVTTFFFHFLYQVSMTLKKLLTSTALQFYNMPTVVLTYQQSFNDNLPVTYSS